TLESILDRGLTVLRDPDEISGPFYLLGYSTGPDDPERAFALREEIRATQGITSCEFRWIPLVPLDSATPNDTWWPNQWNLQMIDVQKAWSITPGDPSVTIAVIDDGFDLGHPDLFFTDPDTHFYSLDYFSGSYPGTPMNAAAGP